MSRLKRVILMVESSRAYGRGCLLGIAAYLRAHGHWQVLHMERGLTEGVPPQAFRWRADGVIARIENLRIARAIARLGAPTVDLRGSLRIPGIATLDTDPDACALMAVDHFLSRGINHLAYCGYEGVGFSDSRRDAFARHLDARGLAPAVFTASRSTSRDVLRREAHGEFSHADIARWLATLPRPLGVFACNDVRGRQVLDACAAAGIAVPDEVAVLGVDNDPVLCDLAHPPLSSVEPDTHKLGLTAATVLEGMMSGAAAPGHVALVSPRGVVGRRSTDTTAVDDPQTAAALRFIRDHAHQRITVEDLMGELAVSRATLERRFLKALGCTPKQRIEQVRTARVCRLLAETDHTLARIAAASGFSSAAHLAVSFKRQAGKTPGQYRRGLSRR